MNKTYRLGETRIKSAGVIRCCLMDVALEHEGHDIVLGAKSACPHCKQTFTLVEGKASPFKESKEIPPVWTPDWQLES